MHSLKKILCFALSAIMLSSLVACHDTKSYAELLTDENYATNSFLVNQRVVTSVPADTVFEVGPDAPFYQLDEEGNVFMQVLNPGTKGNKATSGQLIYFRFTRYSLYNYTFDMSKAGEKGYYGTFTGGEGNDTDLTIGATSFRFDNTTSSASYQWGTGLQMPLYLLPIDCEVNLVIKSQYGLSSEIANVIPYYYRVRYFKSQI